MRSTASIPSWPLIAGMCVLLGLSLWPRSAPTRPAGQKVVLCSFLPIYVFALNIIGNDPEVSLGLLMPPAAGCPHDYALRPDDVKRVLQADLILTNGLGAEQFLEQLLQQRPGIRVVNASINCQVIGDRRTHQCSDPDHHHHGHTHEPGAFNIHVWVSPAEAIRQVRTLADALIAFAPHRSDVYRANADAFIARIEDLRRQFEEAASTFTKRRIVTFHEAFDYLARDLHLTVVDTLSVERGREPSARRMAELIDLISRESVAAVFAEPAYATSGPLARAIARETGVAVYSLNPFNTLQGPPAPDSYERVMSENLETLRRALTSDDTRPTNAGS